MLKVFFYAIKGFLFSDSNAKIYLMIVRANGLKFQVRKVKFRLEGESPLTELVTFPCFNEYFDRSGKELLFFLFVYICPSSFYGDEVILHLVRQIILFLNFNKILVLMSTQFL